MLALTLATTLLALAKAAPLERSVQKRMLECWSTNEEGCVYGTTGSQAAVATEVGTCSEIGVSIIQQGGNAADAMIASALCVGTLASYHSGIAGGGFMVVRYNTEDGGHAYETIDFRETAPALANETMYSQYGANQTKSTVGGLAVAVPAEIRGWESLHSRHGSLPWADLFQPAIKLARDGFPVHPDLATYLSTAHFMLNDTNWSESFAPNGTLLGLGDICYRKKYADTLEKIANEGADAFYTGDLAEGIVRKVLETGGILSLEDLKGYEVNVKNASTIGYRGKQIFSTVAPSSGSITLSALKIFEGFNGSALDNTSSVDLQTQQLVESTKFAYGQRATLGDPAFTANVSMLESSYLTEDVAAAARARIVTNQTFPVGYYNPTNYYPTRESGTSHLATADGSGMAVSLTTTVNLLWGSRVMTDDGIVLNDEMDDFSSPGQVNAFGFAASPINYIAPGKRPQSSICSSIVEDEDGQFIMATGSAGGSRIITATIQELHHYIDQGLNATECSGHPRWHDQLSGTTYFEYPDPSRNLQGYDNSTVASFQAIGYNVTWSAPFDGSTSHAIGRLPNGELLAASDPRKVSGYGAAV